MMKKIGIITKHKIFNYGSFFQAYATQKIIENFGYEVSIIDYIYPNKDHNHSVSIKNRILNYGNSIFKKILPGRPFDVWKFRHESCQNKYYKLTNTYVNQNSIMMNPPDFDVYVSGSDQIWRPDFTKGDSVFFCDFAPLNKKRISFASSFGVTEIPEEFKESYKKMLSKFDFLSVRESDGVEIIRDLINCDAKLVLDPTLILDKHFYDEMLVSPKIDKPYILCYGTSNNKYMERLAKYIQKHTKYEIIRINGKSYDYFSRKIKYVLDAGPLEWLGLFSNASFILAQSFHATAFSIIFEKPFLSIIRGESNHDSRQLNLLKLLEITDKAIVSGETFPDLGNIDFNGNYEHVNELLQKERMNSIEYLKRALKN